ncbi:glycine oxidase ThiO [Salinisphaera sp. USBA-960]|nr:glycine oxidase ThiO [Salifodinibacter halophilus]NNC26031.1 glycine oxidase ThiO [Salifodinibacter halophilus]
MSDFLIIGGGVIGMASALELAEAGHTVTLLERGWCGHEASWAGGGIVSPLYPWEQPDAISRLAIVSESMYPTFTERLVCATGVDPEYHIRGLLYLDPENPTRACAWARRMKQTLRVFDRDAFEGQEPSINTDTGGLSMPDLGSVRNPRLGRALRQYLDQSPRVTLYEHLNVQKLWLRDGHDVVVETSRGAYTGGFTVICAGAWTPRLCADLGVALPIRPVKGQMLLLRPQKLDDFPLLNRVVLHDSRYLIPRADGRILVGSTLEPEAGFDKQPSIKARESLWHTAVAMLPALADYRIEHQWAGLRPGTPDGMPLIGAVPGIARLYVNAGHHRSGLVMAPAAAQLLADILLRRDRIVDPEPFQPVGASNSRYAGMTV